MISIFIHDLEIATIVGVYDEEKIHAQTIRMNLEVGLSSHRACASDALEDTVDYATVCAFIKSELDTHRFVLLERMADHLCRSICTRFNAPWMNISIAKPAKVQGTREVGVRLHYQAVTHPSVQALFQVHMTDPQPIERVQTGVL
jgi:7,8-dihydroneopterin aldolase/epimerase/oxygenase